MEEEKESGGEGGGGKEENEGEGEEDAEERGLAKNACTSLGKRIDEAKRGSKISSEAVKWHVLTPTITDGSALIR